MNNTIFTWNEDRQKEIETLRSRLAEVEKQLIEAHALIAKLSRKEACKPSKLGL